MRYAELVEAEFPFEISHHATSRNEISVVARYKGHPVGVAAYHRDGNCVDDLWVHKDVRRRGIATALYKYIEDLIGQKVEPSDKLTGDGRAFWKKRGLHQRELDRRAVVGGGHVLDALYGSKRIRLA